ncbi:MAG: gliding motility protein GldL [Saprospiraceae bacterium]|nr:gliding motility protein GldL [Saprospiraceae bacterium]
MSLFKSPTFKYTKNLLIGLGASVVMIGALGKINSEPWGGTWITIGLMVEAFLFAMLGIMGPEKDYYWEKLYPGLDQYSSHLTPLTAGGTTGPSRSLNAEVVEGKLSGMLGELQSVAKSLGSLKALQEVDFTQTGEQLKTANNFYSRMNDAISALNDSVEDTKQYQAQLASLSKNLTSLNAVYGNVLSAYQVKS